MTVRLRGRLPAVELNGLAPAEEGLVREPRSKRLVVAVVTVYERRDHGDGVFEPTVEIEHVELLDAKLRDRGVRLLQAAHNARTGERTLFSTEEDDAQADSLPPTTPPVAGPRFLFEPGADSKWWIVLRDEGGVLLAKSGPVGVRGDLTLGRQYTLDEIDALGDDDLSSIARQLEQEAEEREEQWEQAAPDVAPDEHDQDPGRTIQFSGDNEETQTA